MKILELFSGNADITKRLKELGVDAKSVDINKDYSPDFCLDVYKLFDEFFKQYDVLWLSPDCTTYSFASHGLHRIKGGIPVSEKGKEIDILNFELINRLKD